MALPNNVGTGKAHLISAKGSLDALISILNTAAVLYKNDDNVSAYNAAWGLAGKAKSIRFAMDGLHSDISAALIAEYGEGEVGPIVMGPGR